MALSAWLSEIVSTLEGTVRQKRNERDDRLKQSCRAVTRKGDGLPRAMNTSRANPMFASSSSDDGDGRDVAGLAAQGQEVGDRWKQFEWVGQNEATCAAAVLHSPLNDSMESAAKRFRVPVRWLQNLVVVAASLVQQELSSSWCRFIHHLQKLSLSGAVRCLRFTWAPMADETPTRNRVYFTSVGESSKEGIPGEEDESEATDSILAKIMATRNSFSLAFCVPHAAAGASEPGSHAAVGASELGSNAAVGAFESADASELGSDAAAGASELGAYYIVHGGFGSKLRAMEAQTGEIVSKVLLDETVVPEAPIIESIFRDRHWFDNSDLHPSMLVAHRTVAANHPKWHSSHSRCYARSVFYGRVVEKRRWQP